MAKNLIVFDLDGTLAESKSAMDSEMSLLLQQLLLQKSVAVMSGGGYAQFEKQFLTSLQLSNYTLQRLFLFPTCSTSFYRYNEGWQCVYKNSLTEEEKNKIRNAFEMALPLAHYSAPTQIYGELLEDRETQLSFSAFGQEAPGVVKKDWDPQGLKRLEIKKQLDPLLPEFEVRVGGATTIDVTRKGIDKSYGIAQIEKYLRFTKDQMLFLGDALFPGGNDFPVQEAGVDCIHVKGPEHTKKEIRKIINPTFK